MPTIAFYRVPKHIEKEGLGEAVELDQGGAALGSEGFGLVEDGGDAALFWHRRQWNRVRPKFTHHHARHLCASNHIGRKGKKGC